MIFNFKSVLSFDLAQDKKAIFTEIKFPEKFSAKMMNFTLRILIIWSKSGKSDYRVTLLSHILKDWNWKS